MSEKSSHTDSANSLRCVSCQSPLVAGLSAKLCPACLLGSRSTFTNPPTSRSHLSDFVPPAPEDLELIFPEFEMRSLLGRGGMGAVYLAHQTDLERDVAIKILPPETANDPEFQERFRREAATLARLDHPNIVGLFDFGEREGYFYFVMEYVEGADLAARLKSEEFTLEHVLTVIGQICDALDYSHKRGVVHRDIKPANILIDETGGAKIVDFGLAKVVHPDELDPGLTRTQSTMGTPQYMAPEQMAGSKNTDHRSDIYAVGVILYELLTGRVPGGHFKPPSVQNPDLNPRLDEVVLKALKDEPEQRQQQASEIKSGLQDAILRPEKSRSEQARVMTIKVIAAAFTASILGALGVWWIVNQTRSGAADKEALSERQVYLVQRIAANGSIAPTIPAIADGLAQVSLSGARESFGVGIDQRGLVLAWGADRYGQASPPPGLRAQLVVAGQGLRNAHALALIADSSVVGWGDDTFGQASPPKGLANITALAAGETFSIALDRDGKIHAWGKISITDDAAFTAITAGARFAAGLREDGVVVIWGENSGSFGQEVKAISAGHEHLLALTSGGKIINKGGNQPPDDLPIVSKIFAGANGSSAIDLEGNAWFWGKAVEMKGHEFTEVEEIAIGNAEVIVLVK